MIHYKDTNGNFYGTEDSIPTDCTEVTIAEINLANEAKAQADFDTLSYSEKRAAAYPTLTEQNDMAYWDRQNGTTTLDDAITAVKDTYPKGGETL
tara:strand:+ start:230 stop:514 length:285 start_codon:yes stop_codon:yes gene_type:complete